MAYNVRDWFREDIRHEDAEHVALWQGWFAEHGIDPAEVLLTAWVERRTVDGSGGHNVIVWLEAGVRDGEPITVHREIALDSSPAPFPVP